MINSSHYTEEGNDVTLECQASGGNPQRVDSYQWSRSTGYYGDDTTALPTDRIWELKNVSYVDAGEYTCTVMNAGGKGEGRAHLDVHCKYSNNRYVKEKIHKTLNLIE